MELTGDAGSKNVAAVIVTTNLPPYARFGQKIDVVVSSTTVGVAKPDAEIYRYALDRLDILPQEAVFTDDMPTFVEAAVTIGIHARHFSTPEHFREYLAELGVL